MSNIQVVGLGALNMDFIHRTDSVLGDGETVAVSESPESAQDKPFGVAQGKPGAPIFDVKDRKWMGAFPGGSAANTIYGLAKLGMKTGFIGIIGNDPPGAEMVEDFRRVGVDTSRIKIRNGAVTGSTLCYTDSLNFRSIKVTPGANSLLTMIDSDIDYVNQVEFLHISSFVDDAQWQITLDTVKKLEASVKISFSPGELWVSRGLEALAPILAKTYALFINENEIKQLTGKDFSEGAEVCLRTGCRIVAVTLGKGAKIKNTTAAAYIRDAHGEYIIEASEKEIEHRRDTIGAGDAFATGFLYGLLNKKPLDECGRLGDTIARLSITRTGARHGLPTLEELTKAISHPTS